MKVFASVTSVGLIIFLAIYFIKREEAVSTQPSHQLVTKTGRASSTRQIVKNSYAEEKWHLSKPSSVSERSFDEADATDVKLAVLEKLQASDPNSLAPVLRRALRESDENLRIQAVMMTPSLQSAPDDATDIIAAATCDESAEVRNYALEMTREQSVEVKLGVFSTTLASSFPDVREATLVELGRMNSKPAFELLIQGLGNKDLAFVAKVNDELSNLVNARFQSLEEATQWWKINSEKFDDRLIRMAD